MVGFLLIGSLLCCLVGLTTGILTVMQSAFGEEDEATETAKILIGSFVLLLVFGLLYFYPEHKCNEQQWKPNDSYVVHTLVALQDKNAVNGEFHGGLFCSSGYINEKLVYTYAYKTDNDGIKTQQVDADKSTIYYDNNPRAEWITLTRHYWYYSDTKTICNIYLPEGSVASGYNVDLK